MGEAALDKITKLPSSSPSSHFILIHGVSHGCWCWYKVRTLLETSGCRVTCLDLKASGIHHGNVVDIVDFQYYNQPLVDLLTCLPDQQKDCTLAAMLLRPCPVRALSTAVFLEGKCSDKVPRVYVGTLHENVLSIEQQDVMIKRWPPSEVLTVDSDNCPMFSNPSQLFGLLVNVAVCCS